MTTLTHKDFQKISEFLIELYKPCSVKNFPGQLLSIIPKIVASEITIFTYMDSLIETDIRVFTPNNSPHYFTSVDIVDQAVPLTSEECRQHPVVSYYSKTLDGCAHKVSDFMNEAQLYQLEYYGKFLHPLGQEDELCMTFHTNSIAQVSQFNSSPIHVAISVTREQRSFTERDRLILNLLRPHVLQAYLNAQMFAQMEQTLAQSNQALEQAGTIILSGDGKVKLLTQRAWKLLHCYFSLPSQSQLPEKLQGWIRYQISKFAQQGNISSQCLPLQVEQSGRRLTIRLIPNPDKEQYLLLLEEQQFESFSAASLELIGLTKREAEVLFWTAKDKSNAEIAQLLGCSTGTVRKHLEHIYEKLGVQTRTAAVMLALERLGLIK
ncbi:helix-turn-helix transcriptional regulator [Allocoleopsis sp.]|uniref:helix-turn-helix transcriptional regulator n=1 Tax=Allocoleopsis sp. TaxID=3088169 RepID=UPI002FCE82B0